MPNFDDEYRRRELEIRTRELDVRLEEVRLRREELGAKNRKWFSSPLTLAVIGTISGLFATGLSLFLQALSNSSLEQKKMEYSLIQNALSDSNKKQAIRNLNFLEEIGLIKQISLSKLDSISHSADKAPSFAGAVIRDEVISIADAKRMLKKQGSYDGPIDYTDDKHFRHAIAKFQMMQGKIPDGLLGPCTLRELWMTTAEVTPSLQEGKSATVGASNASDNCK